MPLGILWTNCKVINQEVLKQKDENKLCLINNNYLIIVYYNPNTFEMH